MHRFATLGIHPQNRFCAGQFILQLSLNKIMIKKFDSYKFAVPDLREDEDDLDSLDDDAWEEHSC